MSRKLILGISGKKQSGKDTACAVVPYLYAVHQGLIEPEYDYDDPVVEEVTSGLVIQWHFAKLLKQMIHDLLDLPTEMLWGTDEQKNALTQYDWANISPAIKDAVGIKGISADSTGPISAREIMQFVGTEMFRHNFGDQIWVDAAFRGIQKLGADVTLIPDTRFPSEVDAILAKPQGYVMRLLRDPCGKDGHESETALDDFDWNKTKCFVIDNREMSIPEQHVATSKVINGIFDEVMKP